MRESIGIASHKSYRASNPDSGRDESEYTVDIILNNHSLNERSFTPIWQALKEFSFSQNAYMPIARLDLGQNPYLRDSVKPVLS